MMWYDKHIHLDTDEDKWYWYDETGAYRYGPYEHRGDAVKDIQEYADYIEGRLFECGKTS